MKPLIFFDFQKYENDNNFVVIDKERLKEILNEVYLAGVEDGRSKNYSVIAPFGNSRLTWTNNIGETKICGNQKESQN